MLLLRIMIEWVMDKLTHSLQVHVRKVKLIKAPKFDLGNLLSLHGESSTDDSGQKVENREFKETVLESV
jgi:small subunit ribosomal protein S3Ae